MSLDCKGTVRSDAEPAFILRDVTKTGLSETVLWGTPSLLHVPKQYSKEPLNKQSSRWNDEQRLVQTFPDQL
jgi:hypothetical protein